MMQTDVIEMMRPLMLVAPWVVGLVSVLCGASCASEPVVGPAPSESTRPPSVPAHTVAPEFPPGGTLPIEFQDAATRDSIARMVGYFPNTALVTHEGERVRFYENLVRDKCVLIQFMYTNCDGS